MKTFMTKAWEWLRVFVDFALLGVSYVLPAILIVAGLCGILLLGVLGGALVGWVVGWFFTETITAGFLVFGVDISSLAMWQVGAFLGFVSGFFKSTVTTNS